MIASRQTNVAEVRATGNRTVELSFSSEAPIPTRNGVEILDHGIGSVDMSRMSAGAALLFQHDPDQQIGVVERAWIDSVAKKGRAIVRFSKNAHADDIFKDVKDGIRSLISVGYAIIKTVPIPEGYRVTRWQPAEISVVSIPADISVGVGRSEKITTTNTMPPDTDTTHDPIADSLDKRGIPSLTESEIAEVVEICSEYGGNAGDKIRSRVKPDALRKGILAGQKHERDRQKMAREYRPALKSDHDDLAKYSLTRALRMASEGRGVDGLEGEVHADLARRHPEAARGLLIPLNLATRDMTATGGTNGDQGGVTIPTEKRELIDILTAKLSLRQLGATVLTGLTGNVDLPRINAGATATWKTENAALDESSPTLDQVSLRPNRVGCFTEVSRQLLIQDSVSIESWLRNNLMGAIAGAWETAAINGSGSSNQPRGILNTSGIGSVAGGTNGLAPTWAHIVALQGALADANADAGSLGYLTNSKVRSKLKTTLRNPAGTDATYIWPDDGRLNGELTAVSNFVPSNLTKGSAAGICSAIIFGNFADLVLAQWGGAIDVLVNPYAKDTEGLIRIVASTFLDVGVRRPTSFAAMKDALTT